MKPEQIQEFRSFNRFYTDIVGLLDKHILNSKYSLIEARILFELNNGKGLTASDIIGLVDIDKGYLSRILKKFEKARLIKKVDSLKDKRVVALQLSELGKKEFEKLDKASDKQAEDLFKNLSESECNRLITKMAEIRLLMKKGIKYE
ncbi:MarR family winged helix-turn-helix transcriptional regulator [Paraflavitalea pollutisoli]|uniref:MarR family winged helix-turn-helix transcriptional regulator n=1 Tax=Paraflavitalea pollutisoli TaxID=3034143 RepID=UPI0023ED6596|nr:MarR family winged helix-turn-helix transcriptional regulator [Paraflavitalea sp. H1-2-19X]